MDREGKLYQDEMTVEAYRQQLEREPHVVMQKTVARAINNRRARALAAGECVLKAMDAVREASKTNKLMTGSLMWMIDEKVIYPVPGAKDRKEFEYEVMFQVATDKPAYTQERIEELVGDLTYKLQLETDEMFPEDGGNDDKSEEVRSD